MPEQDYALRSCHRNDRKFIWRSAPALVAIGRIALERRAERLARRVVARPVAAARDIDVAVRVDANASVSPLKRRGPGRPDTPENIPPR
jgi:hypothetical protein